MRRLLAFLVAGTLLTAIPVVAQETVRVGEIDAVRVVIAPPQTELARIVKAGLLQNYRGADPDSRAYAEAQKLYFFYGARHFEPLWLTEGTDGSAGFSASALKIMDVFEASAARRLPPVRLPDARPRSRRGRHRSAEARGGRDRVLGLGRFATRSTSTAAASRRRRSRPSGRSRPRRINGTEMLMKLASAEDPAAVLADLEPEHKEFLLLKQALANFNDGLVEQQLSVPEGEVLKPGMDDDRVPLLRQRLNVAEPDIAESATTAPGPSLTYDDPLVEAVKTFQESLGLTGRWRHRARNRRRPQRRRRDDQGRHPRQHGTLALGARGPRRFPRPREPPRVPALR